MTIPAQRRLTLKDLVATAVLAGAGALYAWHLQAPAPGLLQSTRFLSLVLLVLGVVACAIGGSYATAGRYPVVMSWVAAAALALSVAGMASGQESVLGALALVLGLMWLVTTTRHAMGLHPQPAPPPVDGTHELLRTDRHQRV